MKPARIEESAPAKINLTLEILGRRSDGYHELKSLVAFAVDAADRVTLQPDRAFALTADGPEAIAIGGPNLIETVAAAVEADRPGLRFGHFHLEKNLPVASGIGGGSADAAAAIRALARANKIADPHAAFAKLAAAIGADIPVCIGQPSSGRASATDVTAALMMGIGQRVWRPAHGTLLPADGLAAILVNPRVAVATGAVFKALSAPAIDRTHDDGLYLESFRSIPETLTYIAASRNDLEAPAIALAPVIADVLAQLRALPNCRLARMSGSGATCFALFDDIAQAKAAAVTIRNQQPNWWVTPTRLV